MEDQAFLVREPLLNTQERVLGYQFSWQHDTRTGSNNGSSPGTLAHFVAEQLNETDAGALLGDHLLFLDATPALLAEHAFDLLPAGGTVLSVRSADLAPAGALEAVQAARSKGHGISLRDFSVQSGAAGSPDGALLAVATHVEVGFGEPDFAARVDSLRALDNPGLRIVARGVDNWAAYDTCAELGLYAFVGNLHLTRRPGALSRDLNPAQALILQLMDMVRKNADVRQLEGVLKRDAALSYKLLRYINSAGFGLGCEIQSLRHAVTMLGYSPLYRWLALLLATATTTGYSPVLMQTAVIRGRFAELLGQAFLPRNEAENLFVAGMFSLLDKLLGVPMEDVLEKIQLSEPVTQALLAREGIYGPFLALAEACELNSANVESMATSLCIGARQVNQAHLAAVAWAQNLKL